jgi:glycerol dehydrogenase-like iron-containing ADH family enzyme
MIIKTPEQYINQPDILKSSGESIAKLGGNALIIGGKTALAAVGNEFFNSLKGAAVQFAIEEFHDHCTLAAIEKYTSIAGRAEADLIIGTGGGRVLDLAKAVGAKKQIPVITVPTIAATCAAWSALSIIYDENGRFTGGIQLESSPKMVLADTRIIADAPARYLKAGIGDMLAKWYETLPYAEAADNDLTVKIGLQNAELAFNILNNNALQALKDAENKKATRIFREVVDAIIVLAGLVGSISGGTYRAGIAHAINNSLTRIPETHTSLHGEKVIFGVIVQLILEGKPSKEIAETVEFVKALGLPVTLAQLGIDHDLPQRIAEIAGGIKIENEALHQLKFAVTVPSVEQAVIQANRLDENNLKHEEIPLCSRKLYHLYHGKYCKLKNNDIG